MRAKEFIKENDVEERPKVKQNATETVIEYEDMTPAQQRIVTIGLSPSTDVIPDNLTGDELRQWIHEQVDRVKK
jgi:hypothetical protein